MARIIYAYSTTATMLFPTYYSGSHWVPGYPQNTPLTPVFSFSGPSKQDINLPVRNTIIDFADVAGVYVVYYTFELYENPEKLGDIGHTSEGIGKLIYTTQDTLRPDSAYNPYNIPDYNTTFGSPKIPGVTGITQIKKYDVKIPDGLLKVGTQYHWRIIPRVVTGYVIAGTKNLRVLSEYWNDVGITFGFFKTITNPPVINYFDIVNTNSESPLPVSELSEFGGNVVVKWDVSNANTIYIEPQSLPGLGTVSAKGSANVHISETTDFKLKATNTQGEVIKTKTVVVSSPTAITGSFNSSHVFRVPEDLSNGDIVARPGEKYNIQLLTDNITDLLLYVFYPTGSSVTKIDVTPSNIAQMINKETQLPIDITIPDIDGQFSESPTGLRNNSGISGSWGYEAMGADSKIWKGIGNYFKLIKGNRY